MARDRGIGPMSIVFFCQSCGSRFNVDPRMAGKQGRCKKCGEQMTVPQGRGSRREGRQARAGRRRCGRGRRISTGDKLAGEVQPSKVVTGAAHDRSHAGA